LINKVVFGTAQDHRDTVTFLKEEVLNSELFINDLQQISKDFLKG